MGFLVRAKAYALQFSDLLRIYKFEAAKKLKQGLQRKLLCPESKYLN
jgi:hypothetical protein